MDQATFIRSRSRLTPRNGRRNLAHRSFLAPPLVASFLVLRLRSARSLATFAQSEPIPYFITDSYAFVEYKDDHDASDAYHDMFVILLVLWPQTSMDLRSGQHF